MHTCVSLACIAMVLRKLLTSFMLAFGCLGLSGGWHCGEQVSIGGAHCGEHGSEHCDQQRGEHCLEHCDEQRGQHCDEHCCGRCGEHCDVVYWNETGREGMEWHGL